MYGIIFIESGWKGVLMLQSARLTYKLLTDDDFNLFYELYSNEEVMQYAYAARLENHEEAITLFREVLDNQTDSRKGKMYVASLSDEGTAIGIVDYEILFLNEHGGTAEIGYFLLPEYWNEGYGSEMASALIDTIFTETKLHRIQASCQAENNASEKIMQRLSMGCEGVSKYARYKDEQWRDEIRYAILKDEWLKTHTIIQKSDLLMFG